MIPRIAYKIGLTASGYLLAGFFLIAALPQQPTQSEENLTVAVESIQQALNSEGDATIAIPIERKHHPLAWVFGASACLCAAAGTAGLVWLLFGKPEEQVAGATPALLPPALPPAGLPAVKATPTTQTIPTVATVTAPTATPPIQQQPTAIQGSFDERRQQLFNQIRRSRDAWILTLCKRPVLAVGEQGAGKTTFAIALALIRQLFLGFPVEVCDPHANKNPWLAIWKVRGAYNNYGEVERAIADYHQRQKGTHQPGYTSIWDEITTYEGKVSNSEGFIKVVLTDSRKSQEYPIILAHGKTKTCLGGCEGVHDMIQNGLVIVNLFAQTDLWGEATPMGKGIVEGLIRDQSGRLIEAEIALPAWFNPNYLLKLFPEFNQGTHPFYRQPSQPPKRQETPLHKLPNSSNEREPETTREKLQRLYELDNLHPQEIPAREQKLEALYKAVIEYVKSRGGRKTKREIQRATLPVLQGKNADEIEQIMRAIAHLGKGQIETDGNDLVLIVG